MKTQNPMPLAARKNLYQAEIMAVEALDEIVGELIQANKLKATRPFLDWVNIKATSLVVARVNKSSASGSELQTALNALSARNARHAMKSLVGEWMMPHITQQFEQLSGQWHDYRDTEAGQDDADSLDSGFGKVRALDLVL